MNIVERSRHVLLRWLAGRLPDCKHVTALMSRSLDVQLPVRDRLAVAFHRLMCRACARYLTHIKFLRRAMRAQDAGLHNEKEIGLTQYDDGRIRRGE
jgi:anti-sigma factor RsiW